MDHMRARGRASSRYQRAASPILATTPTLLPLESQQPAPDSSNCHRDSSSSSVSPPETSAGVKEHRGQLSCTFPSCGKSFTRKADEIAPVLNDLKADVRTTSYATLRTPNYHCSICGRSFQRLDLLQRHERRQICDDERYPKRLKTAANNSHVPGPLLLAAASEQHQHQPQPQPQPNGVHPVAQSSLSPASAPGNSGPRPDEQQQQQQQQQRLYQSHAVHSHTPTHPQLPQSQPPQSQPHHVHSNTAHSVSPTVLEETFHREVFPVMDLPVVGHAPSSSTTVPAGPNTTSSAGPTPAAATTADLEAGPIAFETQVDFGFGLWPPDPWEALLQDTLHPTFWDENNVPDTQIPWNLTGSLLGTAARAQESAERIGRGREDIIQHRGVGSTLLQRVLTAWPEDALTMSELNEGLSLYWSDVAPSFPFIHRGTLDIDTTPAELVIMMAVVGIVRGSGFSSQRDHRRLVRRIRARLVEDRFGLELEIATLQAFTLCHVYDVWHGDTETLFVAQCMWPAVVAHSRKQGIGVSEGVPPEGHGTAAWFAWAKDEERRRAAYSILFIDTQISSFWSQHPSRQMSIFAHNINLPCTRAQWEAPTAIEWMRAREQEGGASPQSARRSGRGSYMPGLHPEFQVMSVSEGYSSAVLAALAADGPPPIPIDLDNTLSVTMVLTGLCAIAWDCRTRGGMGIRFRDGRKHWRSIVLNAVVNLRAAFELGVSHTAGCVESRDIRDQLAISIISILSDIPMLQVAAGATNICGASIGPKQVADGRRRLRLWVTTTDAWTCLWQSARFLREAMFADWGLYTPWAVFLTTLVIWAYATSIPTITHEDRAQGSYPQPPQDNAHASANAASVLLDTIYMSPTRVDHLDVGVTDLVIAVAAKLKQGAPIDRDNAQLLFRLAGRGGVGPTPNGHVHPQHHPGQHPHQHQGSHQQHHGHQQYQHGHSHQQGPLHHQQHQHQHQHQHSQHHQHQLGQSVAAAARGRAR